MPVRRPILDAVLTWAHPVAAVLVLLVAVDVIWGGGPAGSRDPQGSQVDAFLGVIQSVTIAPGLVTSLLINAAVLRRHGASGWSVAERVLVAVEFAIVAFLQASVLLVLEVGVLRLLAWIAVIVLSALIFTRATARNREARTTIPS